MPQQDWLEKDFYKILGVSETTSEKDLTKAYRKLARKYHPDANPDSVVAENKFKEVSEAYEVLSDPAKKQEYDEFRKYGPTMGFGGGSGNGSHGSGGFGGFQGTDFSDILGDILGGARGRRSSAHSQHGEDLQTELSLTFDEAVKGITTSVNLTSDVVCSTCKGSGAKPGSSPELCSHCGGRGTTDDNQGFFSFTQPCSHCAGRGRVVKNPCPTCNATGTERKPRQVKVRVPPGVKNGQRMRLKGKGAPGRGGGVPGSLYIMLRVGAHKMFGRSGNNLTVNVPITFSEAALGAKIKVPVLDGGEITLKIPSGTPNGKIFRVREKGVSTNSKTGDLLVTVVVDIPKVLTDEQKAALEAFGNTLESPREENLGEATHD